MSAVVCVCLLLSTTPALAGVGPMDLLKQRNNEVEHLLKQKVAPATAEERKQKNALKTLAATLLNYQELGKRALAQHWEKLSNKQHDDFIRTFRELLERNYLRQMGGSVNYSIKYLDEKIEANEATVTTEMRVKTAGKPTDADVVYKLSRVGAKWMVYDIITDEVSLLRNYRSQFHKIIAEKSFDELIKKMRAKLAETD